MKKLSEIFYMKSSQNLELINCEQVENGICFISRTSKNNGVAARILPIDDLEPMPAGAITVALSGSVLSSFYQDESFYTAFHIACLYPKQPLSIEQLHYYACVIEQNKYRYSFGRQANRTLKDILLPDINELPDYVNKISNADYQFEKEPISNRKISLNTENWQWFKISALFNVYSSQEENAVDRLEGNTPYISSTQFSNGISKYVDDVPSFPMNTITVARNGSIGSAFYQPVPFCASPDDVRIFEPKFELNKYIAIFLITIIEKEKFRYEYGRKFGTKRMNDTKVKLPTTPEGNPDWQFMESYVKSLSYSKSI
jgi:hypothetical protein